MQITNFYTKPFLKGLFYALMLFGIGLMILGFTGLQFMPLPIHLGVGVLFVIAALLLLTREFFVRYDSKSELIEIDRSGLFSKNEDFAPRSHLGFVKFQIRDYEMRDHWFGSVLLLTYEKRNGERFNKRVPLALFSKRHIQIIKRDLNRIISGNSDMNLFIGSSFKNPYIG